MPARTRSTIRLRSSSATAPKTVNTILPAGVEVSICSEKETKSIPNALKVSKARRRWETDRAKRSNRQTQTTSNRRLWAGRELRKSGSSSARDVFKQTVEAAGAIKPGAWETPAIFLQVSDELWNLGEKEEARELLRRAIELAKQPRQLFEASKTLAGCARVLARWGNLSEGIEVAQAIQSPEQRRTVLEELQKGSARG